MKKNKQTFTPGQMCLFDRYNFLCQKENSTKLVSIVRPAFTRTGLFSRKKCWVCLVYSTNELITVDEELLCPICTKEEYDKISDLIVIRNPVNLPEINQDDINNLNDIMSILNEIVARRLMPNRQIPITINRTKKLLLKFNFYSKMINTNVTPVMINGEPDEMEENDI